MKQSQALNILKMGESVFLTGRAGSGKTYVLNQYIKYLHQHNIPVGVTASTGIAATHLNGTTIHSWSGIGIADELTNEVIEKLLTKKYLRDHYVNSTVLIIDEISMLHAHQLDMVNQLAQIFRQDLRPFGGLQIVLCGDFFQLPPVSQGDKASKFAVESEIWKKMNLRICYLQEQHRQDDPDFLNLLNQIRAGEIDDNVYELLSQRIGASLAEGIQPTKLYTHNINVDEINLTELSRIDGKTQEYVMQTRGRHNLVDVLKRGCLAQEVLRLKVGANVMFLKNKFELGVVNGTRGKVVDFDELNFPIVELKNGEQVTVEPEIWMIEDNHQILAQLKQIPLRLAWAITVHKSQGMSLELAEVDLTKSFQPGMGYVALSRVSSLSGLSLIGFNDMALQVNPQILDYDKALQVVSDETVERLKELSAQEIIKRQKDFVTRYGQKEKTKANKKASYLYTLELLQKKMDLQKIADKQGLKINTIMNHIEKLIFEGARLDLDYLKLKSHLDKKDFEKIKSAFDKCGLEKLSPVFDYLGDKYSYDDLRLTRLILMSEKQG